MLSVTMGATLSRILRLYLVGRTRHDQLRTRSRRRAWDGMRGLYLLLCAYNNRRVNLTIIFFDLICTTLVDHLVQKGNQLVKRLFRHTRIPNAEISVARVG